MNYSLLIKESEKELLKAEKHRGPALDRDRARFLRLLKTGECRTQQEAGAAIGLGQRQAQRLWRTYREKGFESLKTQPSARGWGKITSWHIGQLNRYLESNQAQQLRDIQRYLADNFQIHYTIAGISALCKRLKIKRKKGRPVHIRQQEGDVALFKKTSRP